MRGLSPKRLANGTPAGIAMRFSYKLVTMKPQPGFQQLLIDVSMSLLSVRYLSIIGSKVFVLSKDTTF